MIKCYPQLIYARTYTDSLFSLSCVFQAGDCVEYLLNEPLARKMLRMRNPRGKSSLDSVLYCDSNLLLLFLEKMPLSKLKIFECRQSITESVMCCVPAQGERALAVLRRLLIHEHSAFANQNTEEIPGPWVSYAEKFPRRFVPDYDGTEWRKATHLDLSTREFVKEEFRDIFTQHPLLRAVKIGDYDLVRLVFFYLPPGYALNRGVMVACIVQALVEDKVEIMEFLMIPDLTDEDIFGTIASFQGRVLGWNCSLSLYRQGLLRDYMDALMIGALDPELGLDMRCRREDSEKFLALAVLEGDGYLTVSNENVPAKRAFEILRKLPLEMKMHISLAYTGRAGFIREVKDELLSWAL